MGLSTYMGTNLISSMDTHLPRRQRCSGAPATVLACAVTKLHYSNENSGKELP